MTDQMEIDTLMHPEEQEITQYESEKWGYIPDYNNGNYQTQIQFSTQTVREKKIVWSDGYVTAPIKINAGPGVGAVVYTAETKVALKQSVLSLIYGVVLNNIGGTNIVNDTQVQFINNIRLMLDNDVDWLTCKSSELFLGLDRVEWNPASGPYPAAGNLPSTETARNRGFLERVTFVQMQGFNVADAAFEFLAYIPLRYIHPIFAAASFPMINSNFELFLQTSFGSNSAYPPLQVEGATQPVISISGGNALVSQNNCRLYYKYIELKPKENAVFLANLAKGYKIRRRYASCDVFAQLPGFQNKSQQALNNTVITANIVRPIALYALLFPAGVINGPTYNANYGTVLAANAPMTPIGRLTNIQITMNNEAVLNTPLEGNIDVWAQMKERLIAYEADIAGAPITYYDFLTSQHIHYFDLSKQTSKLNNPSQQVSISMTANRPAYDNVLCDYVFLVEKEMVVEFDMSGGNCTIVSGQNI